MTIRQIHFAMHNFLIMTYRDCPKWRTPSILLDRASSHNNWFRSAGRLEFLVPIEWSVPHAHCILVLVPRPWCLRVHTTNVHMYTAHCTFVKNEHRERVVILFPDPDVGGKIAPTSHSALYVYSLQTCTVYMGYINPNVGGTDCACTEQTPWSWNQD